ncbi:MAG: hypothetical protein E6190_03125 [Finegoldia magna]|uniref:hypothetical protein n=1 Tax=Finegoldia magna TaxID=1260 RepID=UPI00291073E3|nr:hypothetical protein [Finegoldia magna]MDU5214674.1 hypothetical protein [Finegoldia magna]
MLRAKVGSRLYNINEAIKLGEIAIASLNEVQSYLGTASGWGIFDIFKGKTITTMIKRSNLKKAKNQAKKADLAIRKFNNIMIDLDKKPSVGFRYKKPFFLADYFDNKVFDSVIQMQILSNKKNCENAIKQLKKEVYNLQKEKMNLMND